MRVSQLFEMFAFLRFPKRHLFKNDEKKMSMWMKMSSHFDF